MNYTVQGWGYWMGSKEGGAAQVLLKTDRLREIFVSLFDLLLTLSETVLGACGGLAEVD